METVQLAFSDANIIGAVMQNAVDARFTEGSVPYVMNGGRITPIDAPRVSREDIANFVQSTAPSEAAEKFRNIINKVRENYTLGEHWELVDYGVSTSKNFYRCVISMSMSGASISIRNIPN